MGNGQVGESEPFDPLLGVGVPDGYRLCHTVTGRNAPRRWKFSKNPAPRSVSRRVAAIRLGLPTAPPANCYIRF